MQVKKKGWVLSSKEGSEGTKFTYTLTVDTMTCLGSASKKKDAKNQAYRSISIYLVLLL